MQHQVTGVVLAGGQGRRMDGRDKGLVRLAGRTLTEHVIRALAPQVAQIVVNANRNQGIYAAFGHPVIADTEYGLQGPLSGILAGLDAAHTPFVVTVPCDAPLLPSDLVDRLWRAHVHDNAQVCVAHDGERMQPLFVLLPVEAAGSLRDYLHQGGRQAREWLRQQQANAVDFGDSHECFVNVNDEAELKTIEQRLGDREP